jgi:putative nucleotidyltransferase with HDIG domain
LLKLANSAAFGTSSCQTVMQALGRMGTKQIKTLFVQMATREIFKSRSPDITAAFLRIWDHSVAVALLARDVAGLVGGIDHDMAYQAGLLHDIGKPVLAIMLLELERAQSGNNNRRTFMSPAVWLEAVNAEHRAISTALTRKWNMPVEVQQSVEVCGDYDPANRLSIGNVVRFCNSLAKVAGVYAGSVDADEANALVMVGRSLIGLETDVSERLLANLQTRVQEVLG